MLCFGRKLEAEGKCSTHDPDRKSNQTSTGDLFHPNFAPTCIQFTRKLKENKKKKKQEKTRKTQVIIIQFKRKTQGKQEEEKNKKNTGKTQVIIIQFIRKTQGINKKKKKQGKHR